MKKNLKLKPFVIPSIYALAIFLVVISTVITSKSLKADIPPIDNNWYVSSIIFGNSVPVIAPEKVVIRPYNNIEVKVGKNYYDYTAEKDKQQTAIIFHENVYIQNSGVDYVLETQFDVLSILDGTVISVKDTELLGKVIEVRHENDMISTYQSLKEVSVKKDDVIKQGQIIGKTGISQFNKELGNHLHLELFYQGKVVDPELFFDKKVKDL